MKIMIAILVLMSAVGCAHDPNYDRTDPRNRPTYHSIPR